MEEVVLVDSNDTELGLLEKYACHRRPPKLHRAISIFLFNKPGQMLITKRSGSKKTWPDFWSNAVCSHPRKGETPEEAASRRLMEELGIKTGLRHVFTFEYAADYNAEWGENELDWVFVGVYDGTPKPAKGEISDWKFVDIVELAADVERSPGRYTPWFKIALPRVLKHMNL